MESTSAAMESAFVAVSGPDSTCIAGEVEIAGERVMAEEWVSVGEGLLMSGCVCCIFTVAFGIAGLLGAAPSGGRVMRAVSFFGAAGFSGVVAAGAGGGCGGLGAAAPGVGAGLSGTVARAPPSDGGFGGSCTPLAGLAGGKGMPAWEGGRGGGGSGGLAPNDGATGEGASVGVAGGDVGTAPSKRGISIRAVSLAAAGAGGVRLAGITIFVVSFFGSLPSGGKVGAGLPGRLMRTVSRFTVVV